MKHKDRPTADAVFQSLLRELAAVQAAERWCRGRGRGKSKLVYPKRLTEGANDLVEDDEHGLGCRKFQEFSAQSAKELLEQGGFGTMLETNMTKDMFSISKLNKTMEVHINAKHNKVLVEYRNLGLFVDQLEWWKLLNKNEFHFSAVDGWHIDRRTSRGYIICPLAERTLNQHIYTTGYTLREATNWLLQIHAALSFLHQKGIFHANLSPSCILLWGRGMSIRAKLGFNPYVVRQKDAGKRTHPCGFLRYMAPEKLQSVKTGLCCDSEQSDYYSFAMTCFEVYAKRQPFPFLKETGCSHLETFYRYVCQGKQRPNLPSDIPSSVRSLIRQCWDHDPKVRQAHWNELGWELGRLRAHPDQSLGLRVSRRLSR